MEKLAHSASALGLYAYGQAIPSNGIFLKFYNSVIELCKLVNLEPTYISIAGDGYNGKYVKVGGRVHQKLLKSNFSHITSISLVVNPIGSDEPAYDSFISISFGVVPSSQEISLYCVINEAIIPFASELYDFALDKFLVLWKWDFGFGFADEVKRKPEFHLLGINSGVLSKDELAALKTWYATPAERRIAKLRNIYPYNLVNEKQLNQTAEMSCSLKDLILQHSGSTLVNTSIDGLSLWKITNLSLIHEMQNKLKSTDIFC